MTFKEIDDALNGLVSLVVIKDLQKQHVAHRVTTSFPTTPTMAVKTPG
jgi:hypothetical protein